MAGSAALGEAAEPQLEGGQLEGDLDVGLGGGLVEQVGGGMERGTRRPAGDRVDVVQARVAQQRVLDLDDLVQGEQVTVGDLVQVEPAAAGPFQVPAGLATTATSEAGMTGGPVTGWGGVRRICR